MKSAEQTAAAHGNPPNQSPKVFQDTAQAADAAGHRTSCPIGQDRAFRNGATELPPALRLLSRRADAETMNQILARPSRCSPSVSAIIRIRLLLNVGRNKWRNIHHPSAVMPLAAPGSLGSILWQCHGRCAGRGTRHLVTPFPEIHSHQDRNHEKGGTEFARHISGFAVIHCKWIKELLNERVVSGM